MDEEDGRSGVIVAQITYVKVNTCEECYRHVYMDNLHQCMDWCTLPCKYVQDMKPCKFGKRRIVRSGEDR